MSDTPAAAAAVGPAGTVTVRRLRPGRRLGPTRHGGTVGPGPAAARRRAGDSDHLHRDGGSLAGRGSESAGRGPGGARKIGSDSETRHWHGLPTWQLELDLNLHWHPSHLASLVGPDSDPLALALAPWWSLPVRLGAGLPAGPGPGGGA